MVDATYINDLASLKLLLEFGTDPNALRADGYTPLRAGCEKIHEDGVKKFLEYGVDPNISAPDWTPLIYALYRNNECIVHLLLQYRADLDLVMPSGWTSLTYACEPDVLLSICGGTPSLWC